LLYTNNRAGCCSSGAIRIQGRGKEWFYVGVLSEDKERRNAMDARFEEAQWRLNVVEWALIGMTETDHEPERKDLTSLRVFVGEANQDLDAAIEETSK
jgi:hypothetical protein